MTRKHFNAIAAEFREIKDAKARREAAIAMARAAREINPNFCRDRFLAACNVEA